MTLTITQHEHTMNVLCERRKMPFTGNRLPERSPWSIGNRKMMENVKSFIMAPSDAKIFPLLLHQMNDFVRIHTQSTAPGVLDGAKAWAEKVCADLRRTLTVLPQPMKPGAAPGEPTPWVIPSKTARKHGALHFTVIEGIPQASATWRRWAHSVAPCVGYVNLGEVGFVRDMDGGNHRLWKNPHTPETMIARINEVIDFFTIDWGEETHLQAVADAVAHIKRKKADLEEAQKRLDIKREWLSNLHDPEWLAEQRRIAQEEVDHHLSAVHEGMHAVHLAEVARDDAISKFEDYTEGVEE